MTDLNRHIDFQMLLDGSADFTMDNLPGVGQLYVHFTVPELEQMREQLNQMRSNRSGFDLQVDIEVDDVRKGDYLMGHRILHKEITESGRIRLTMDSKAIFQFDGGTAVTIERRIA